MRGRVLPGALALAVLAAGNAPAAGSGGEGSAPSPPRKKVDEPVFQLPELVIIGENRARIMAQKERLADTPMRGLREAPLLEKEEGTVAGVRRRVSVAIAEESPLGASGLARLEGGSPGFAGGAIWVGRRRDDSLQSLGVFGSQLAGQGQAGKTAGGREFGIAVGSGYISRHDAPDQGASPAWARALAPLGIPDSGSASLGWRRVSRELPYSAGVGDWRHLDRIFLTGESARSRNGFSGMGQLSLIRLDALGDAMTGVGFTGASLLPVWRSEMVALVFRPRGEAEVVKVTGSRFLLGGDLEASMTPGRRWRMFAGITADWAAGEGNPAGHLGAVGGLSWTSPWGPSLAVSFTPGLEMPWASIETARIPYSSFSSPPVPGRVDGDLKAEIWQEHWDGSELGLEFHYRETRDALSWESIAGGMWEPAALSRLEVAEVTLRVRLLQLAPARLSASGTWRSVAATGGEKANLPRAEGVLEAEYPWRAFTLEAGLEVVQERPGSFSNAAGNIDPFRNLRVRGAWRALERLEIYVRGNNLLGQSIERWQGYPEPGGFVSAGAVASF